jgi:3-oxoacyl-[acyl-carrier-protein] synthase-3
MPTELPLKIVGVGRYLPKRILRNEDTEAQFGMEPGWILAKQGVRERRVVDDETASEMGAHAAREAIEEAGWTLQDVDLFLNASGTAEQSVPDGGPLLQRALGLEDSGVPCFTVHATCLSFLVALDLASSLLATGRYRNIVIVSSDISSCATDTPNIEVASLFGDAAAAVAVTRTPEGETSALLAARLRTWSSGANFTRILGGGTRYHPNRAGATPDENRFQMEGIRVYRMARTRAPELLEELWPGITTDSGDISLVIPHQASKLALDALSLVDLPQEKIVRTLEFAGNCIAASLPLTLHHAVRQGRVHRGEKILFFGTGAGLSIGGIVLRY